VNQGSASFNNLLVDAKVVEPFRVDFVAHARAMGALAERARTLDEVRAAYRRAKAADRSTVIVVETDPHTWTEGGAWWDVGVPEVSEREEVRVARAVLDAERKHQRIGV
jgi:3D-(3,5/4)-trihydroxycyclohexane-1,2-dione acylhydrolase (decyclizing)